MENHAIDQKLNRRIAIIGAGAAGLTAAEALRERGYKNVTIFERTNRAGGKCLSVEIENRVYDLGAGIVSGNNQAVLELAKRFSVAYKRVVFGRSIVVDAQTGDRVAKKNLWQLIKLMLEMFRYKKLLSRFSSVSKPGFLKADAELSQSFSDFAKTHRIEHLAHELMLFFTGFGYGYFDEIPAAYVLKYYSSKTICSFMKRQIYFFPNGIQGLWETIAKTHDVRFHSNISRMERSEKITIFVDNETFEFDELIVTSPLDETHEYLDQTTEENTMFSKILTVDYRTIACTVSGLKKVSGYIPGNFSSTRLGHPVFWNLHFENANVYTFYLIASEQIMDDVVKQNLEVFVKKMGGTVEQVHSIEHWKYFPHVSSQEMKNGFFDIIETIQGKRHTYYAGELFNFSTVGLTSEYAKDLVERFF